MFERELRPGDVIIFSWYRQRILANFGIGQSIYAPQEDFSKAKALLTHLSKIATIAGEKNANLSLVDDVPEVCENDDFKSGRLSFERDVISWEG